MSEQGPFDAAIDILMGESNWHRDERGGVVPNGNVAPAIRVLEVVAKMDKRRIALCLDAADEYLGIAGDEGWESIRALIEALPEPEGERK